jgi:polysaccharide export outer membrane protein
MRAPQFIFFIWILAVTTSCSYRQNQLLFEKKNTPLVNEPAAPGTSSLTTGYKIQPQDMLQIRNLQNIKYIVDEAPSGAGGSSGSSGQTYMVEEDGTVALPVIGRVKVEGLTRVQAAKQIEGLYKANLLKDPIIELKVVNLKVILMGEVRSPGNYPLTKDNITLVELIGEAGGLSANANEKNIKIIRGGKQVSEIDMGNIASVSDPNAVLQNGDIVYVLQNKRAIRNDKLQNISTIVQPALLLLNTALLIYTLTK